MKGLTHQYWLVAVIDKQDAQLSLRQLRLKRSDDSFASARVPVTELMGLQRADVTSETAWQPRKAPSQTLDVSYRFHAVDAAISFWAQH